MRRVSCVIAIVVSAALVALAQTRGAKTLDIYVVDVEGGNATLFVSPSGQSFLIDTGNGGMGAVRDAGRIFDAAKDTGLTQIDHLITTHWHGDHYGGLAELASRIPIRPFIDHGPTVRKNEATEKYLQTIYPQLYAKSKHTVVKPGRSTPRAPGMFIANLIDEQQYVMPLAPMPLPQPGPNVPPPPAHNGRAYWIKLSAQEDGTFTMTNARNGFSKVYRGM